MILFPLYSLSTRRSCSFRLWKQVPESFVQYLKIVGVDSRLDSVNLVLWGVECVQFCQQELVHCSSNVCIRCFFWKISIRLVNSQEKERKLNLLTIIRVRDVGKLEV